MYIYIHYTTTNTDLGDSPLHIYNTLATTMLLGQTKVQVPCLPHQCYINTEMYCWATFCVGVFPPMRRVIWKARDTPGSWEVLHTSQASTSCLLSTSVYQVKVANSTNWPLQCKTQYTFDIVRYEVNESKSSHQESNPGSPGLSCQCWL